MKFILKPSLKHMTLVKIAISLLDQNDIRDSMMKLRFPCYFSPTYLTWMEIEEKVMKKVSQLLLPQLLKEKVLSFVKPIGIQISMWMKYNYKYVNENLPAEFCWTPQGTIDGKRTAGVLVKNKILHMSTRYILACIYCLEDDIYELWNHMPEDLKESDWNEFPIISFWSFNMKKKGLNNAHIVYKNKFRLSAEDGNKVAAEYFLQKLTPREREECLVETAKNVTDADALIFLLSEMNKEQQMEVFKMNPYTVLPCFLQWPFQGFFIIVANCMWDFLSKENYYYTLRDITFKVRDDYRDWDYQKLFREFWQGSPISLKSLITNEIDKSWLLPYLIAVKDKENIRLILKDTTFTVREKFIYSYRMNIFCQCYINDNKWDLLKFFIRECLPSENSMLKFKEEFEKCNKLANVEDNLAKNRQKWEQLFSFSDDSIFEYNKRSSDEDKTT